MSECGVQSASQLILWWVVKSKDTKICFWSRPKLRGEKVKRYFSKIENVASTHARRWKPSDFRQKILLLHVVWDEGWRVTKNEAKSTRVSVSRITKPIDCGPITRPKLNGLILSQHKYINLGVSLNEFCLKEQLTHAFGLQSIGIAWSTLVDFHSPPVPNGREVHLENGLKTIGESAFFKLHC